jgi:hypothetical protein
MNPVVRAVKTPRDNYFCFRLNALRVEKAVRTGSDGFRHSASAGGAGLLAEPRKLVVGVCRGTSPGRHCHSTRSLTGIACHFLGFYTVILQSSLSFSAKMTLLLRATEHRKAPCARAQAGAVVGEGLAEAGPG